MSDFKDERIIKLKEQANEEFRQMNITITSIEELVRMFGENVLAFNCSARRYAEILSRLLAESEQTPIPNFDAPTREADTDDDSGEVRGETGRPAPEQLPPMADNPEVLEGDSGSRREEAQAV